VWSGNLKTYKLDIGLQYPIRIGKSDQLTLGASMSLGHTIKSKIGLIRYTSLGDTIQSQARNAFEMPHTFGAGVSWKHGEQLTLAADYRMEQWEGCKTPVSQATQAANNIRVTTDQYIDMHHVAVGAEYTHDLYGKYRQRITYRMGASYSSPYVKVNGHDGPKEYSVESVVHNRMSEVDVKALAEILKKKASEGWKLVSVIDDDGGKLISSLGGSETASLSGGTLNTKEDRVILIFERPVQDTRRVR
jgi:hypothetical protein